MDMKRAAERTLELARRHEDKWAAPDPSLDLDHLRGMLDRWPDHSPAKAGRWLGWLQAAVVASLPDQVDLDDMKHINVTSQPRESLCPTRLASVCNRILSEAGNEAGFTHPVFRIERTTGDGFRVLRTAIGYGHADLDREALVAEADREGVIRAVSDPEGVVGGAAEEVLSDMNAEKAAFRSRRGDAVATETPVSDPEPS